MRNYTRRRFLKLAGIGLVAAGLPACRIPFGKTSTRPDTDEKPNFIVIFTDDQGYGDVGCYGATKIRTPRLDRMAKEGMRFTNFYAQTVCGPSRSALMTGCYPLRLAKKNNSVTTHPYVHSTEITIAEILKDRGYATGCFGKWDQAGHKQNGYDEALLPTQQGFDYFFGTPSSNDSIVNLLRNDKMIEKKADMNTLTQRYTDEAIGFIQEHRDEPFFVYIPHTMPHTILGVSDAFRGTSEGGIYGDVIEEIDWNVGRILDIVKKLGLDKSTYVIFTSDNGPWLIRKAHGGSAGPLRGGKTSTWEGGLRVPCIMRAPGRIPPNTVCDEIASTMDILPTLAKIAGGSAPTDRVIDGHDIGDLIHGVEGATGPTDAFFYYQCTHLQAVRSGKWKLHLPRPADPPWTPNWSKHIAPEDVFDIETPLLYDLENDIGERIDVADKNPDVVKRLLDLAEWARDDIGDYNRIGKNARFPDPQPPRPDIAKLNRKPLPDKRKKGRKTL